MDAKVRRVSPPQKLPQRLEVREIPVDHILPDPNQPREYFDEEALEELSNSILSQGLQQLPTVNFAYEKDGKPYYYIKGGERRWTVHKRLGISKMPCVIDLRPYDGTYSLERKLAQAAENSSREPHTHSEIINLTEEVVREELELREDNPAGAVHAALKRVAEAFGKSIAWATNYRVLTGLLPEFRRMLDLKDDEERLNFMVGCSLARAPHDVQASAYAKAHKLLKSGGHIAVQRYIVVEVRKIREDRGEKIRGKRPSDERKLFTTMIGGLNRQAVNFCGERHSSEHKLYVAKVLSSLSIHEVEEALGTLKVVLTTFGDLRTQLEARREEHYKHFRK